MLGWVKSSSQLGWSCGSGPVVIVSMLAQEICRFDLIIQQWLNSESCLVFFGYTGLYFCLSSPCRELTLEQPKHSTVPSNGGGKQLRSWRQGRTAASFRSSYLPLLSFVLSQDELVTGCFTDLHHLIRTLGQALRTKLASAADLLSLQALNLQDMPRHQ